MSVGLSTAEILHLLYKYYGGISFFNGMPLFLLVECLENAVKKEQTLPTIINEVYKYLSGEKSSFYSKKLTPINKKMRSSEEILKSYGMM